MSSKTFFKNGITNATSNEIYICLIPKKVGTCKVNDCRFIWLTSHLYQIIAKVVLERFKKVLPLTVFDYQSSFVEGHQILNASPFVNEWKRKKKGTILLLDIKKTFDNVD